MNGRRLAVLAAVLAALTAPAAPAVAKHPDEQIVLPGATSAEGIAKGVGSTFYAGDLFAGDIYRGDLQRGTAEVLLLRHRDEAAKLMQGEIHTPQGIGRYEIGFGRASR